MRVTVKESVPKRDMNRPEPSAQSQGRLRLHRLAFKKLMGMGLFGVVLLSARLHASPVVFGYEQLHAPNLPSGDKSAQAAAGALLFAELRCSACHRDSESLPSSQGSSRSVDLSNVGSRISRDAIVEWLRSPASVKPGTTMPSCFGAGEDDARSISEIAAYLASLSNNVYPEFPPGDVARGRELYHQVGCVACHAPEVPVVAPSVRSVPLALGKFYETGALVGFLQNPLETRPHGKMPAFGLSPAEAADLAAYIKRDTAKRDPDSRTRSLSNAAGDMVQKGRAAFVQKGCISCHADGSKDVAEQRTTQGALRPQSGCLSETLPAGVPDYKLDVAQRKALREFVSAPPSGVIQPPLIEQLNCLACHVRDGRGGPESSRAAYFKANDPGAESLGELGHLPPKLDAVGAKLTRKWLEKLFWRGGGAVRPYLNARMPQFGEASGGALIECLLNADRNAAPAQIDVSGVQGHQRGPIGRQLVGTSGLGCVSCHGILGRKSLGPTVLQLTHVTERLQPEYFKRLLLNPQVTQPGTLMPPLFAGRKAAEKEIESIWTYLREAASLPLPEGLLSQGDFELKPGSVGRPIVFRSFVEGAGTHAVAVGFPEGVNLCFDARTCRWKVAWKGRFLDAMNNWKERAMPPIAPLGNQVNALTPAEEAANVRLKFVGYRLDANGVPSFLYEVNGVEIEDRAEPFADGGGFTRSVRILKGGTEIRVPSILSGELVVGRDKREEALSW